MKTISSIVAIFFLRNLKANFVLLISLYVTFAGWSQNACSNIYEFDQLDTEAEYKLGAQSVMDDTQLLIVPIINECASTGDEMITSLHVKLLIDTEGKVADFIFIRFNASDSCKERLKQTMMNLTGWTPATKKGVNVCSYFYWNISCITGG